MTYPDTLDTVLVPGTSTTVLVPELLTRILAVEESQEVERLYLKKKLNFTIGKNAK